MVLGDLKCNHRQSSKAQTVLRIKKHIQLIHETIYPIRWFVGSSACRSSSRPSRDQYYKTIFAIIEL